MTAKETRLARVEGELRVLETMVVALVELLSERQTISHEEWDARVKRLFEEERELIDFRRFQS